MLDQNGMGIFLLGDLLELDAQLLMVFTGLALGTVVAAARTADARAGAVEQVAPVSG